MTFYGKQTKKTQKINFENFEFSKKFLAEKKGIFGRLFGKKQTKMLPGA